MSSSRPFGLTHGAALPCDWAMGVVQNLRLLQCPLPTRPAARAPERDLRIHAHDPSKASAPRLSRARISGSISTIHSSLAQSLHNSCAAESMYSSSLARSISSNSSAQWIPGRSFGRTAESISNSHSQSPSTFSSSSARSSFCSDVTAQWISSSSSCSRSAQGISSSHGPSPSRFSSSSARSSSRRRAAVGRAKAGAPPRAVATEELDAGTSGEDLSAAEPPGSAPHIPVLLEEILGFFQGREVRTFVDGTLGAGGHSAAMLRAHPELQHLVALDLDPRAHAEAAPRLAAVVQQRTGRPVAADAAPSGSSESATGEAGPQGPRLSLVRANFGDLGRVLAELSPPAAEGGCDGILLDLGMSSMQVDDAARGFSFLRDGPLDMRMDPEAALSAEALVNTWGEAELGALLRDWGEERHWRAIARRIVEARGASPITTTGRLVQLIGGPRTGRGLHPATRTFQALRMAVNGEQAALRAALPAAVRALREGGGRLAVISFHSLEDRIVKRAFLAAAVDGAADAGLLDQVAEGRLEGWAAKPKRASKSKYPAKYSREEAAMAATLGGGPSSGGSRAQSDAKGVVEEYANEEAPRGYRVLTKRPVVADELELRVNARSRSAKLRVLERL